MVIAFRRQLRGRGYPAALFCAAAACVAGLAGCGGSHPDTGHASAPARKPAKVTATPPRAIRQVSYAEPMPGGAEHLRVSIYDLRRQGPYLVLDFGLSCSAPGGAGCSSGSDAMAPQSQTSTGGQIESEEVDAWTASGVNLIDPDTLTQYLPVRDAEHRPFASQLPWTTDSRTHLAWVRYPAPPASVAALDLTLPDGGPQIPDVPITDGPAPTAVGGLVPADPAPFAVTPDSTETTGLSFPVHKLATLSGNPTASDDESASRSSITLSSDVLFRFAKSDLTAGARSILSHVAAQISARADGPVHVTGYTDSIGSDAVNIPLSKARAGAVVRALRSFTHGVRYVAAGKGAADPVAPNTTAAGGDDPAGRALNRRVTIVFAVKPAASRPVSTATTGSATAPAPPSSAVSFTVDSDPGSRPDVYRATPALYRDGSALVLRLDLTCIKPSQSYGCDTEYGLQGTRTIPPIAPQSAMFEFGAWGTPSGFYLTDPATGTDYAVLHDRRGLAITAVAENYLPAHHTLPYWLYFPAPSQQVSTMTLTTPGSHRSVSVPVLPSAS